MTVHIDTREISFIQRQINGVYRQVSQLGEERFASVLTALEDATRALDRAAFFPAETATT